MGSVDLFFLLLLFHLGFFQQIGIVKTIIILFYLFTRIPFLYRHSYIGGPAGKRGSPAASAAAGAAL